MSHPKYVPATFHPRMETDLVFETLTEKVQELCKAKTYTTIVITLSSVGG
jgi:hypothetical protein